MPVPSFDELLESCHARLHIMDGLVRSLAEPHALVELLAAARTLDESHAVLKERLDLDDLQATAVLDLQFRLLNEWSRAQITSERDALVAQIAELRQGNRE